RRPPRSPPFPYTTLFRSYLAIETGPASGHEVERLARERDAVAAFRTFDSTYPWALPFYTWREEGEMAASIVRESGVTRDALWGLDRKSTRLNSSHVAISY